MCEYAYIERQCINHITLDCRISPTQCIYLICYVGWMEELVTGCTNLLYFSGHNQPTRAWLLLTKFSMKIHSIPFSRSHYYSSNYCFFLMLNSPVSPCSSIMQPSLNVKRNEQTTRYLARNGCARGPSEIDQSSQKGVFHTWRPQFSFDLFSHQCLYVKSA